MLKIFKFLIAALASASVCSLLFYFLDPNAIYVTYRCLTASFDSPFRCYSGQPFSFQTRTLGITYDGNTRDEIDRGVLAFGGHEKPQMFFLRDVCNGGIFVDVGANKGLYSLFMSKYAKEVHAFEPYPPVLRKFFHLVEINEIKNIIIHPVGLGEKHERLVFQEPEGENEGRGSFVFVSPAAGKHREFEIMTGDEALKKAGASKIDLLKIDVEGFEKPVLKGLRATLAYSRPLVAFELTIDPTWPILFQNMKEIENAFPANYKFLMFRDWDLYTGRYELGTVNIDFSRTATAPNNIIAFPAERPVPLKGPSDKF